MATVPLALKAYQRDTAFQPEALCVNMYLEKDESGASPDNIMRLQRPGMVSYATMTGTARGIYQQDGVVGGEFFGVAGTKVYTLSGSTTEAGTIEAGGMVAFAGASDKLTIVSDSIVYYHNGTTATAYTLPDDAPGTVIDAETINDYTILLFSSGRFYWVEPGETTVDELNFATAESSPDGAIAVRRLGDELFFFGTQTIEPWQKTGNQDAPFAPAAGRQYDRGCISRDTVRRFDNSLLWVGDDGVVYRVAAVPQRISDHGIEERIRKREGDLSALLMEADGHKFYVLRIPGQGSFAYDVSTQAWSEFQSLDREEWRPHVSELISGVTYAADSESGKVWRLDSDVSNDDGDTIPRIVSGTVALQGSPARMDSVSLGVGASADCLVSIRWRDGNEPFDDEATGFQVEAPADIVTLYRLGQARQPFRTFLVECYDDVRIRISGMVTGAWQ